MRITRTLLITVALIPFSLVLYASDGPMDAGRTATLDFLVENAISRGLIAGGVVVVGNHNGILYSSARGRRLPATDSAPLSEQTIFDVASLTKVFATTPAVMKLLETGAISLTNPITRWFPEFVGSGREDITILNLLTHTSGLDDSALSSGAPLETIVQRAAAQKRWRVPGDRFRYADTNFILLGELVRRVTGIPLDRFCQDNFYGPLGMADTMFLPPAERVPCIAPTLGPAHEYLTGVVQDEVARRLGGVAGHAGLFSSAQDLARFIRMLLSGGMFDGERVFSDRVMRQMTAPYFYSNGAVVRGLGWDIYSPYSAPKGDFFSEMSFGHTGYSGSSVWIDPQRDLFVILLTNRLDYRDTRLFNQLRSDISTLTVAVFASHAKTRSAESGQSH